MGVIDADAHVIETERTWSFMLEEDRRFAPELLVSTKNGVEFWRIDERVFPNSNLGLNVPEESRDLTDVTSRLAHMDSLGIDIQVLYPSLFLRPLTARAEVELALCRGYNRWLAQIWKLGKGRLRWVVLPPLRFMDRAIEEINFGKANGACGVFMRGFEGERLLSDSSLFPVYEEAQRLDLPICIHAGTGNFGYYDQFGQDVFSRFKLPSVGAFNNLIYQGVPEKFPDLRWSFVETTSQWIPYAIIAERCVRLQKIGAVHHEEVFARQDFKMRAEQKKCARLLERAVVRRDDEEVILPGILSFDDIAGKFRASRLAIIKQRRHARPFFIGTVMRCEGEAGDGMHR